MKITHISVRNYRSLKSFDIDVDPYTALLGANGSGKSCLLYALDWFFNGTPLMQTDISGFREGVELPEEDKTVEVTVTFGNLTPQDKARLKQYGRGSTASFRRSWTPDSKDKVVGNATQGPGFAEVRNMSRVGDFRPAYESLRRSIPTLPDLGHMASKEQIVSAFTAWEDDPANSARLVAINDDDANHMFGINGPNVINECVRLVLIPAGGDIATQVGYAGKGSALNELIGSLLSNASATARATWFEEHSDKVNELNKLIRESVEKSTLMQATRINSRLGQLVPNASIQFNTSVPDWTPKNDATVTTDVTIDGLTNDVARQGHGVQRAVMIAMFQSLVPDETYTTGTHQPENGESEEEAQARLKLELQNLPALIVGIEEPEIYQHPIRARAFARILADLAAQPTAQVLVATHSSYFVRPQQFSNLRRFYLDSGVSHMKRTSVSAVAVAAECDEDHVEKIVEKRLPTGFSEGFFCEAVAVVEGDTDKAVLEAIAEKLGTPFDTKGVSVLDMGGKEGVRIPYCMFNELGVPAYIIADGDALGAARKHSGDAMKQASAHASHRNATDNIISWLPSSTAIKGTLPYSFEDPTVVAEHFTIWEDDIEEELSKWPSFISALAANGGTLRSKDLLAYRAAVLDADIADLPDILKECVSAISNWGH